jgi:hypothetical protein
MKDGLAVHASKQMCYYLLKRKVAPVPIVYNDAFTLPQT